MRLQQSYPSKQSTVNEIKKKYEDNHVLQFLLWFRKPRKTTIRGNKITRRKTADESHKNAIEISHDLLN